MWIRNPELDEVKLHVHVKVLLDVKVLVDVNLLLDLKVPVHLKVPVQVKVLVDLKVPVHQKEVLGHRISSGGVQVLIDEFVDMLLKGEAHSFMCLLKIVLRVGFHETHGKAPQGTWQNARTFPSDTWL